MKLSEMSYKQKQTVFTRDVMRANRSLNRTTKKKKKFHSVVLKTCISQAARMKIGKVLKQKEMAKS